MATFSEHVEAFIAGRHEHDAANELGVEPYMLTVNLGGLPDDALATISERVGVPVEELRRGRDEYAKAFSAQIAARAGRVVESIQRPRIGPSPLPGMQNAAILQSLKRLEKAVGVLLELAQAQSSPDEALRRRIRRAREALAAAEAPSQVAEAPSE
jgi:hypothetical protein